MGRVGGGGGSHEKESGGRLHDRDREEKEVDISDGRLWLGGKAPAVITSDVRDRTVVLVGRPEYSYERDRDEILDSLGSLVHYKEVQIFRGTAETFIINPHSKTHEHPKVLKVKFKNKELAKVAYKRLTRVIKTIGAVYVREDYTLEELMHDARLRKKCWELNQQGGKKYTVRDQCIVEVGTLRPYVENPGTKGPSSFIRHNLDNARGSAPFVGSVSSARSLTTNEPVDVVPSFGNVIGDIENTKDKFAMSMDVRAFKRKELEVKVDGRKLTITGERNEHKESGLHFFIHKYTLPEDVKLEGLHSFVTDDRKLMIEAPKRAIKGPQARSIPIDRA